MLWNFFFQQSSFDYCILMLLHTVAHINAQWIYLLGITVLRTIHNLLTVWRILRGTPEFNSWLILDVNTSAYGISSLAEIRVKCSIICITCVWFTGTAENAKKKKKLAVIIWSLPSKKSYCSLILLAQQIKKTILLKSKTFIHSQFWLNLK